jgi:hypothetical protein
MITSCLDADPRGELVQPHSGICLGPDEAAFPPCAPDRIRQHASRESHIAAHHQVAVEFQPEAVAVKQTSKRARIPRSGSSKQRTFP